MTRATRVPSETMPDEVDGDRTAVGEPSGPPRASEYGDPAVPSAHRGGRRRR